MSRTRKLPRSRPSGRIIVLDDRKIPQKTINPRPLSNPHVLKNTPPGEGKWKRRGTIQKSTPYGEKKNQNNPAGLTKIVALEQKFLDDLRFAEQGRKDKDEFSV